MLLLYEGTKGRYLKGAAMNHFDPTLFIVAAIVIGAVSYSNDRWEGSARGLATGVVLSVIYFIGINL